MPFDLERVSGLLEQALALAPGARAPFLDRACEGDEELRAELVSLLAAHPAASGYFESLSDEIVSPVLATLVGDGLEDIAPGQMVSHYRIIEKLGAGGMGVVFKAEDLRLGRLVALKFLPAHRSADAGAKARFLAEAQSASALDHPNIAVVHEIGQTDDGRLFIVMAYYEGRTLDRPAGPWAIDRALAIIEQVAEALAAAHARGVVHRDVKPGNILVTPGGAAKLLDFGIAKLARMDLTGPGPALGTPAYMSPEQTRGSRVDHRTDVWSLGVVLYEMLAGVRPFDADRDEAVIYAIRHDECEPLDRLRPELSPGVVHLVRRCMAKDPEARYPAVEDLMADLRALRTGAVLSTPAGGARHHLWRYGAAALVTGVLAALAWAYQPHAPVRLAVLPLSTTAATDPEGYLGEAFTSELIVQLSQMSALRVIGRESVAQARTGAKDTLEIARHLRAAAVLDGSLEQTPTGTQIRLRLLDATNAKLLWTERYTRDWDTLQGMPRDIAQRVAGVLRLRVADAERRRLVAGTSSPAAYQLYLKGRHFLAKADGPSAAQAKDFFEQALDLDTEFARAWSGLADAYHELGVREPLPAADVYPRARAAAEQALSIDPDLAEAHVSLGTALSFHYWEFDTAAEHYLRAIALNPSHADAHQYYAEYLRYRGRFDEALERAKQAEFLDPLSPQPQQEQAIILYLARRYDEAAALMRRLMDIHPRLVGGNFLLALVHVQKREFAEADAALDAIGADESWHAATLRAVIHAAAGRPAQARAALGRLRALTPEPRTAAWHLAMVHLALGEHERALDLLEQAYEARAWELRLLPVEPLFDPIRTHPRFIALANQVR